MRYLLIIIASCSLLQGAAQREHLDKGDEFYRQKFYREAIEEYKKALSENVVVNKHYMTRQIARTYHMLFDYQKAEEWFEKLIGMGEEGDTLDMLYYAQVLCNNQQYEKAKDIYGLYARKTDRDPQNYERLATWPLEHNDTAWSMQVYPANIETGSRSMGIWLHKDRMYYAQPVIDEFQEQTAFYDLAVMKRIDSVSFGEPKKMGGNLNRSFYEGTPYITPDGESIYFAANASEATKYRDKERRLNKARLSASGDNTLNIYLTRKEGEEWSDPVLISINSIQYNCVFPSFSMDGKYLYYASDKPGGKGGYDLYRALKLSDSTFAEPENLGDAVNTELDEMYPFLNDTALFFATRGLPGYGGADIFYLKHGTSNAINLGMPINSSKDDFSMILLPNEDQLLKGYLSSNRSGQHGYDSVYYFAQDPWPVYPDTISGFAFNRITEEPLTDVKITLERYIDSESLELDSMCTTGMQGEVTLYLDKEVPFRVTFRKEGFKRVEFEIPAAEREDVVAYFGRITMEPEAKKNTIIDIPNIYFDYDKATIREESFPILDNIVNYLNANPDIRVELSAHTDSRGSDWYNLRLSDRRAKSTLDYLVKKGIDPSRLISKGYGEKMLRNHCKNGVQCTDEEHEYNRRVEMKIL